MIKLLLPVGVMLDMAPYVFMGYFPYGDKVKISPVRILAIFLIPASIEFFVFYHFPISYPLVHDVFLAFLPVYSVIYILTLRIEFSKSFCVLLICCDYASNIIGISNFLESTLFPHCLRVGGYSIEYIIINLAGFLITLPISLLIMFKKVRPLLDLENAKAWRKLWIIPLMYFFTIIAFSGSEQNELLSSWQYITVTLTMSVGGFVVLYIISEMLIKTDENATLRENVRMMEMQVDYQKGAYENLKKRIAETKAARHDLRHHLSVIERYLQLGNYTALQDYLNEYKSSIPDTGELTVSENSAVNMIILHYAEVARSEGVSVTTRLQLPKKTDISDSDLCIVLGNCMENALEACRAMKSGQKYIRIKSRSHGDILGIAIDNSYDGECRIKGDNFLSRKRNGEEGLGISSVRAVAQKYNGKALFTFDKNEFQASIILNMRRTLTTV